MKKKTKDDELFSIRDAARKSGYSHQRVYQLVMPQGPGRRYLNPLVPGDDYRIIASHYYITEAGLRKLIARRESLTV